VVINTVKKRKSIILTVVILYSLHLLAACFFEIVPREVQEFRGKRYEIRRGPGFPGAFIPGVVMLAAFDMNCRLVIVDPNSRDTETRNFDQPSDVYETYPEVWVNKPSERR
jgi:hypothetical protein